MRKGGVAWLGLAGYVVAYDFWACKKGHETMSGAFGRALDHKYTRLPALLLMVIIVKHLAAPKVLPKADPLNRIAEYWRIDNGKKIHTIIMTEEVGVISSPRPIPG